MKNKRFSQSGFTLIEMIITVFITIILLAISIIGITTYMKHLKITELDNSAKQIYIAAQNRAILLKGSQLLKQYVIKADDSNKMEFVQVIPNSSETVQTTAYFIHCSDENIEQLLPKESIESLLWEGDFYIIYEPESGSIMDTFFAEENLPIEENFRNFYDKWRAEEKEKRMNNSPMIGYYGGEAAESGTTISLRTPVINIYNNDTLSAEVTYWIPRLLYTMGENENVSIDIKLNYKDNVVTLDKDNAQENITDEGISYYSFTSTWIFDSLEDGKQFKDIFLDDTITMGDNFTIEAAVSYTGDYKINGAKKIAEDNSLFAKDTTEDTAYIEYMRHLQNLDMKFSNVSSDKTSALQIKDIKSAQDYDFKPIDNNFLQNYDGQNFKIYGLTSKLTTDKPLGLFSKIYGSVTSYKELKNIKLVDTNIENTSYPAAALVGEGRYVNITGCQVYWENTFENGTDLRDILGDSSKGFNYKIISQAQAGGLAGVLKNSVIENCSSSTLIKGDSVNIGGLVGEAENITINKSYSSSYLEGKNASGLIGNTLSEVNISNTYAVGFIDSLENGKAAGLCLGNGNAVISNSYSAMLFTSKNVNNYPLCEKSGDYNNVYYLESDLFNFDKTDKDYGILYEELTNLNKLNQLFDSGAFEQKNAISSHPYNLQTTLSLTVFIYPGLKNMEHFGDWGAQFQNGSLVYYEQYNNADGSYSYGISGGGMDYLENIPASKDGYGVAYNGTDFTLGIDVTLNITYKDSEFSTKTDTIKYTASNVLKVNAVNKITGKEESYYVMPLPDNIVDSQYASSNFYQQITIVKDMSQKSYYYNPHFADAILPYNSAINPEDLAKGLTVKIRTPRHLFSLSKFDTYYTSYNKYKFIQQMDLDYSLYSGYNLFPQKIGIQDPIGVSFDKPFRNNYDGNSYVIKGVKINSLDLDNNNYQYIGLFGYNTGVLKDVVYFMDSITKTSIIQSGSSSKTTYVGGLIGYNGGSVENCAVAGVQIEADCYNYSTVYLGAMAGLNQGSIECSSADAESILASATMSNAYVGGFVGLNNIGGIIEQSYCVGYASASRARYGDVVVTGFAPENKGIIIKSYCATSIYAEGGAESFGFSKDSSSDSVYLNDGNFIYNSINYTAQYNDNSAKSINWNMLTGALASEDIDKLGMSYNTKAYGSSTEIYPYPGVVTDKEGNTIHYGNWPNIMQLGDMGIYYWEKAQMDGHTSYRLSVLSAYFEQKVITKESTLSMAHDDGMVITEYGYGFFHTNEIAPSLASSGIGYENNVDFKYGTSKENTDANDNLKKLVSDKYVFHSYNTWNTDTAQSLSGLYLKSQNQTLGEPPSGTWTLTNSGYNISFKINPFFADSMSYLKPTYDGFTHNELVPLDTPGSTENNAYEIRSIKQIQFINWNVNKMNTITSIENKADLWGNPIQGNEKEFMFLSYVDAQTKMVFNKSYYWLQTHDLYANDVDYTPIAAFKDTVIGDGNNIQESWAYGWFGGKYNGNDYTIQDLSINTNGINTTGLFGFTVNADLKNIILYSPNSDAEIIAQNNGDNWYAIGGIVGLAANTVGSTGSIQNCAVAGYNIYDKNEYCAYGGGGVGGVVGICNMQLQKCTAVTNINIDFGHSKDNRNVRVGGIAGSCQKNITQCYAGGEIKVSDTIEYSASKVHIGGIVGGYFMKTLKINDSNIIQSDLSKQSTIQSCYSYVTLPNENKLNNNSNMFVIGGRGEITNSQGNFLCDYENCFYLNQNLNNITNINKILDYNKNKSCSYEELSVGGTVFNNLTNNYGFSTITTESSSGANIDGRYSFGTSGYLLGQNYPFPTILSQSSDIVQSGKANVHYGDWVYPGIKREDGALPISIDLFADYNEKEGNAIWTEELSLLNVASGGYWQYQSLDNTVADVTLIPIDKDKQTLKVIAKKQGNTIITIKYNVNGNTYSLNISVNVSANLQVMADALPVIVFNNETAYVDLKLKDYHGDDIKNSLLSKIKINEITAEYDNNMLYNVNKDSGYGLSVESLDQTGFTQLTMMYQYNYNGEDYLGSNVVSLDILKPNIKLNPITVEFDENNEKLIYSYSKDNIEINVDGVNINDISIVNFEMIPEYAEYVWAEFEEGSENNTILIELNSPVVQEMVVEIKIQFRFLYGGSTHNMWQNQQINIKKLNDNPF